MFAWRSMKVWGAVSVGLAACIASAQLAQRADIVRRGGIVNPENFDAKDPQQGVYPPESMTAMERLAHAERMERQKEWNTSADLYQEILLDPQFATKVVPSHEDADHHIDQYASVIDLVMQRLSRWPQEGLAVYLARYEAPAQALLETAKGDDLFVLQQVFSRYFVTEAGKIAGIRLIDHDLESGEFRAAAVHGERLLKWHPRILDERPGLLYRIAIAYHLAGDDAEARIYLDDLKKHDPQAKGTVRGKDVLLADSLAEELGQPVLTATGSTSDSYKTFGGDETRNRILAVSGTPGAHLYSIQLSKPTRVNSPQAQVLDARYKEDAKNGATIGVMPAVDRGELFFQDGERLYGLNLESGVPLTGWAQSHGPDHDGAYTLPGVSGSPRSHQLTVTVADHSVLAVMGQQDTNLLRVGMGQQGETRLVCLDRTTGKENWVIAPSQFKQPSLKALQFGGSPMVVGETVLIVGTATEQAFEHYYVLCFDLNNGTLRWNSDLGSSSTVAPAWAGFNQNPVQPANESHLAYSNGRVYVQTNRGTIAALDAYNGTINWLDIYSRGKQAMMNPAFNPMFMQPGQFPQDQTKPWAFNPLIVSQGMLFTLPTEGKHLLIYEAASGQEIKKIDLADLAHQIKGDTVVDQEDFSTMAGVIGDMLIVVGNHTVVALNWKTYDSDHYDDGKMLFWDAPYAKAVRGRPFLTSTRLFLPMEDHLYMLDLKTGSVVDEYPKHPRTWEDGEDDKPGNVLATSDHMVIANADRVDVYTDLQAAKKKLDREVAEAPNDPQPRLRYAEVMYAAGDYDTALVKLDEAITRLGGPDSMLPGPVRGRVFSDALTFAQKLKNAAAKGDRDRVDQLFDRANLASLSPDQKVQYRMARAKFDELKNDPPSALKLYQEILADAATRAVPLANEATNTPASADVVARKQVAALIEKDPQIYDPFEKLAAAALEQAQSSNDPAKLLNVAQSFPNSTVAGKATLAAADAYEAAGNLRAARHVLSDVYFDHNEKSPEWAQILEAMARTDSRTAAHMLSLGLAQLNNPKLTKPLKLSDGSEIAAGTFFSAALEQVRKVRDAQQAQSLPTFALPIPQNYKKYPKPFLPDSPIIARVDALAVPLRDFGRPDRIVAWSAAPLLSIYAAGSEKPIAGTDQFAEEPKGCAWIDHDVLVWGATQIALVKADGTQAPWKLDVGKLASIDVIAAEQPAPDVEQVALNNRIRGNGLVLNQGGRVFIRNGVVMPVPAMGGAAAKPVHDGPEEIDQVLPVGERVLVATTSGRVVSVDARTGRLAWQTRLSDRQVDRLLADGDFTVIQAEDDNSIRLAVLDTFSGHVRGTKTFQRSSNSYPQNVALSPDGTLVYTLPDRICLKDLYRPWDQKGIEKAVPQGQPATFQGMTEPDQLVISEGRILALTDSGNAVGPGEKFVRLYSLETGEPILLNFAAGQVEKALSIGSKSSDVSLRVIGPRMYVMAPDAAISYNLDNPDDHYQMFDHESDGMSEQMSFIGKDYLILLNGGAPAPAPAAANAQPNAAPQQPALPSPTPPVSPRPGRRSKEDWSTCPMTTNFTCCWALENNERELKGYLRPFVIPQSSPSVPR
jgi:outer membrane protein assembly factor BamB